MAAASAALSDATDLTSWAWARPCTLCMTPTRRKPACLNATASLTTSTRRRENLADLVGDVDLIEGDIQSYKRVHNAVRGAM